MLKYYNAMVVFREIPDEITLAINITNCPCRCKGCHSNFLWDDVGEPLTFYELSKLIETNKGITCICFMGGDSKPYVVNSLAAYIREEYRELKVAWYSGREKISDEIDKANFDFIKIGPYIEEFGGLDKETTNQCMFEVKDGKLNDITKKMQTKIEDI